MHLVGLPAVKAASGWSALALLPLLPRPGDSHCPDRYKLALGYRLDEVTNEIIGTTPAAFEPAEEYVVVQLPHFAFEKFPGADTTLGLSPKSVEKLWPMAATSSRLC